MVRFKKLPLKNYLVFIIYCSLAPLIKEEIWILYAQIMFGLTGVKV